MHSDYLAGDTLQKDIRNWLSPPDPWKNHYIARESHHEGTSAWLVEGETFSEWKSSGPSSLLWIHGKRESLSGAYSLIFDHPHPS
jgi:ankyrin repeat domain-containing protein 50